MSKGKNNSYYDLSPMNISINVLPLYNLQNATIEEIKFKNTEKQRAVYKITKENSSYCLKKVYYDIPNLLFVYSSIEWWYKHGINVPRILSSKEGCKYVQYNGMLFILTPWILGKKCDYNNYSNLKTLMINLAKMHKFGINFFPVENSNFRQSYSILYNSMNKHWENLLTYSNLAYKHKDTFSKCYIDNFNINYDLGEISSKSSFSINNNNLTKTLCHKDYVNKNLIFDKKNNIWVIDFDKVSCDYAAHDISYALRRLFKRDHTNWDFTLCKDLLNFYNEIMPLNVDDYKYILSYLSFPQKFWKISRDYYKNIKKCNKKSFCSILYKSTKNSNSQLLFSLNLKAYIEDKFKINI